MSAEITITQYIQADYDRHGATGAEATTWIMTASTEIDGEMHEHTERALFEEGLVGEQADFDSIAAWARAVAITEAASMDLWVDPAIEVSAIREESGYGVDAYGGSVHSRSWTIPAQTAYAHEVGL